MRTKFLVLLALCSVGLVACGSTAVTLQFSAPGAPVVYAVLSGGDTDVASLQQYVIQRGSSSASGAGESVVDGDEHHGSRVCETDISHGGRSGHVVLYSTPALPATTCSVFTQP